MCRTRARENGQQERQGLRWTCLQRDWLCSAANWKSAILLQQWLKHEWVRLNGAVLVISHGHVQPLWATVQMEGFKKAKVSVPTPSPSCFPFCHIDWWAGYQWDCENIATFPHYPGALGGRKWPVNMHYSMLTCLEGMLWLTMRPADSHTPCCLD